MDDNLSYFRTDGTPPLLEQTIPAHLAEITSRFPEQEAVVSRPQGRRLSYRRLDAAVAKLAKGLMALGFGKGERIGIWSTNNIEWLLIQLATARIGAILVNINPAYRSRELAFALQRSEIQGLFLIPAFKSSDYVAILSELVPELHECSSDTLACKDFPFLRRVVLYEPADPIATKRPASGFTLWGEVLARSAAVSNTALAKRTAGLNPHEPINIQYTSGTTGFPKAVVLSHRNILNNAYFSALAMHFSEQDRLCVPVPFYHCFGMVLANLLCLSVGACIVIACQHFEAGQVLAAVAAERCTAIHGVPTMFIAELEHPSFSELDLTSLRTGIMAGAPCPPALMQRVIQDLHCSEILIGYGETEASPLTHLTTREDTLECRINTVGRNLPHQEVKVVDLASGRTLPLGEVGEICFRGYHIMQGYYHDPEATAKAIDQAGWLHSGDLGKMDRDGYVQITGRLKEMIIRGGENIYPREIEDYLFTHAKVAGVAVFGVPDDYYGEEIMAWIKPRNGVEISEEEIRAFCRGKIAHFKIPKYIWFVEEFPMTVTGKLQKYKMRELAVARLQQDKDNG
ncbi:MAG: AMP-binding protein [Desulfocapsaceae bacterium]|nr:AMP-binding protein [Desulfocapsaceae bacterium]